MKHYARYGYLIALMLTANACAAAVEPVESEVDAPSEKRMLVSLQMSPTHKIEFFERGEILASVEEELDVDVDLADGRLTLALTEARHSLVDQYMYLAGDAADPLAIERLRVVDERIVASREGAELDQGEPEATVTDVPVPALPQQAVRQSDSDVAVATSAVTCNSDLNWDFAADTLWFQTNFCGNGSQVCRTLQVPGSQVTVNDSFVFRTTGFAQSFCSTANWFVQSKYRKPFPLFTTTTTEQINATLLPRHLNTQQFVVGGNGTHSWFARITSHTGADFTALAALF